MGSFILTLFITFVVLAGAGILINYCKTRPRNGKHQLTGMCHRSGGATCSSCSDFKQ